MHFIINEAPNFALSPLAAAISFAIAASATPLISHAQQTSGDAPAKSEPRQLSKLVAKDVEEEPIKVDQVASPKFTQPLVDTPQTITVVTQAVLQQQGTGTLVEALANTPGITLQLGENGNTSAGDTFSMRGSSSQTNIFVDGIRDLGAITRDTFNTAQVEIAKGAVGADYGRGASSGDINQVSKLPQADNFGAASLSASTAVSLRAASDLNFSLTDGSAIRFNAVWQNGNAVGRDFVENNRWGVAPSIAFGLNTATRYYLYSQHVRANNVPDGGIPAIGLPGFYNATLAATGINPASVNTENFYGRYTDFEDTKADMATLRIEHDFSDTFKLVNSTRYGQSDMDRVFNGVNALTLSATTNPSTWTVSRTQQLTFQDNTLLTNQTNLNLRFNTGFVAHDLASGIELIKEEQGSMGWTGFGVLPAYLNGGTATALPNANLYNPDAYFSYASPYNPVKTGAYTDGSTKTYAGYVFDTLKFGERWLVTAGGRYEHYDTGYYSVAINATTGAATATDSNADDTLLSWKGALTFKPLTNGSIYVAYSNSLTPPGNDSFTLSATVNNINNPNFDPQEATNIEVGTKWDLLDARLALNAAVYRTDNQNQLIQLDASTNEYVQYGRRRVQGAEFGAVGKVTDRLSLIAGIAWSDNEEIDGTTTGNTATGSTARWAPEYSANLWTTYSANRWTAGLGANYVDEQKRVVDPTAVVSTSPLPSIPGYTVVNGMFSYAVTDSLGVQLNVNNLFDKFYLSSLNNSGTRARIGAPRNAQLTANFRF
jgi:catecholate siderophore receptor